MREEGFSMKLIHPYKDRIVDSVFIRGNSGQSKLVFLHISGSVMQAKNF